MEIYDLDNEKYPSIIEALVLVVLFMVLQILCGLAVGYLGERLNLPDYETLGFFINFLLIPVITGVTVISYGLWRGGYKWKSLFKEKKISLYFYIIVFLISVGLSVSLSEVDSWLRNIYPMTEIWQELFQTIYKANIVVSFIAIAIVPPIIEEVLFRGIILRGFLKIYSPIVAIILSASLFAVIHINIWQMVPAFIAGLALGWIYYRSKSLLLVIFSHAVFNANAVLGSRYTSIQDLTAQLTDQSLWLFISGLLVVIFGCLLFHRALSKTY